MLLIKSKNKKKLGIFIEVICAETLLSLCCKDVRVKARQMDMKPV